MDERLSGYIDRNEDEKIDFKRTEFLRVGHDLAKALVAFANRRGGKLIFGVTDDGEIEGADIQKEEALRIMSQTASDWCHPRIDFSPVWFWSQDDGSRIGDVFVVDVESSQSIPHAVGTKKERTFYIRAGNESRPVTDPSELDWLFTRSVPEEFDYSTDVYFYFNSSDLSTRVIEPMPNGWSCLGPFFENLNRDDRQVIERNEEELIPQFISEITPFAILLSVTPDFWISHASEKYSRTEILEEILGPKGETTTDEILLTEISFDDNPVRDDIPRGILSKMNLDPLDVLEQEATFEWMDGERIGTIVVPRDTHISIRYLAPEVSRLELNKETAFEFWIDSGKLSSNRSGKLPSGHPLEDRKFPNLSIAKAYLEFRGEFDFPDGEDPRLKQHVAFGEGWKKTLEENWNLENQTVDRWDKVFHMEERLSRIESMLTE